MTGLKPLFTARWALALILAITAAATCILLGLWQWHRFEIRSAAVSAVTQNYDADPVPITTVLSSPTAQLSAAQDYTVVEARGTYCTEPQCVLYVRNRTLGSSVGFWQLVPFRVSHGGTIMTVRGWVDGASAGSEPASQPPVPQGEVTVRMRLRPSEPQLKARALVPGQLQSVNAPDVRGQTGERSTLYEGAYGVAFDEQGPGARAARGLPHALEKPETTRGPHLSYAFQWWVFSTLFPIGFVVAARRALADAAYESSSQDARVKRVQPGKSQASRARRKHRHTNEEEEDAFLDERGLS